MESHPPIIAQFVFCYVKEEWIAAARGKGHIWSTDINPALQKSQIYINHHLTADSKKILGRARKLRREKKIYAAYINGKVLVKAKDGDNPTRVTAVEDLDQFDKDGIVLFRAKNLQNKFEDNSITYSGAAEKADIDTWINKNYHGLVGYRTRENGQDFKTPLVVAYYAVDYVKNPKGTNYWRNRILKVAKEYSQDFTFAVSSKDDFQHELNEYGFDYVPTEKPLVLSRDANNKKYVMKDEFSVENFEKFLKDLKNGNVEPYLKSEPIPEENNAPVKVAVAKNFDEIVTNNNKDTFIEFYAPWCGHCKKLTPIWDELGEKLKDEDVEIVKMDASNNDVSGPYEVRGFPTLYWAPKDSKSSPVRYEGGRELNDFIKYVAKSATSELKGYDRKGNQKKTEL